MGKQTVLFECHKKLGAKIIDFARWMMPVSYSSISEEHLAVREQVGLFDVSHMGELMITGPEAKDLVQWVTSNNVDNLINGKAQYSCFPNEDGGIVDDLIVYQLAENKFMLVVNASNIQKDFNWINEHNKFDATIRNVSDDWSLLALQGPKALELLQELSDVNLNEIKFYHFEIGTVANISDVIISATGYTGSGGFELYVKNESAVPLWEAIMELATKYNLKPAGLGARDTLRLEMGYCLYGNDIDDKTSPLEAGLGWITKLSTDFVGKEPIAALKQKGIERKLVGFKMLEKGFPRQFYDIKNLENQSVGIVTSGGKSISTDQGIGLGYVNKEIAQVGNRIQIAVRKKLVNAEIVKLPFYEPGN